MVYAPEKEQSGVNGLAPILSVKFEVKPRSVVMRLQGALNGSSIAALEAQYDQLRSAPCDDVVLDVGELTELDVMGANLLRRIQQDVRARGGHVRLLGFEPKGAAPNPESELQSA